jgi:hypothetical protein
MSDELKEEKIRLKKDGTLVQKQDGNDVVIATYDKASGHLEFETAEFSRKYYNQVAARIGTVQNGTQPSGNVIRTMGLKGQPKPSKAGPKRPKAGPEGDGDPVVVNFYVTTPERKLEAIVRYGIYTDKEGNFIRKKVRRVVETRNDYRHLEDDQIPYTRTGPRTQDKSPVSIGHKVVEVRNGIIARRGTRHEDDPEVLDRLGVDKLEALFTPQEVVGGFAVDDEDEGGDGYEVGSEDSAEGGDTNE